MKLKLSKEKVRTTFEIAERFAGDGKILGNDALIELKDGKGTISSTDGTYSFTGNFETVNIEEEGKFLIPIKKFTNLLKELPQGEFSVHTDKGKIILKGKKFKYTMLSNNVENFVFLTPTKCDNIIKINSVKLSEALKKVYFAADKGDGKILLNSVYLNIDGEDTDMVATDTTRMAYKTLVTQDNIKIQNGNKANIIIPISTIQNLLPLLENYDGEVEIKLCDTLIQFVFNNGFIITSKIIADKYPNYKSIATMDMNDFEIIIHRKEVLNALKRIEKISDEKIVNLSFSKQELTLKNRAADQGEGTELLDIINKEGYDKSINYSIPLLMDILKNSTTDELVLKLCEDTSKPLGIKEYQGDDKYIYIIMPIRS